MESQIAAQECRESKQVENSAAVELEKEESLFISEVEKQIGVSSEASNTQSPPSSFKLIIKLVSLTLLLLLANAIYGRVQTHQTQKLPDTTPHAQALQTPSSSHPQPNTDLNALSTQLQTNPQTLNQSSPHFNLWDFTIDQKRQMLKKFAKFTEAQVSAQSNQMKIVSDPDQQTASIFEDFEKHSQVIDWTKIEIDDQTRRKYEQQFDASLKSIKKQIQSAIHHFKDYQNSDQLASQKNNSITKKDFFNSIEYLKLTGNPSAPENKETLSKYRAHIEQTYRISQYPSELRACIIVPTFNNTARSRYMWNLESLLMQEYDNYKVVFVDDASPDNTSARIATYLRLRDAPAHKFTVIRSNRRNKSLFSFYYAAHRYCALGEIIYTIDGDDQLIGTQVLKLVNALYQSQKTYTLYTTFFVKTDKPLRVGNNQNYSQQTIKNNAFRRDQSHAYSHLRTMLSDTFLLADIASLKDKDGSFYGMMTDNAVYFSAMELSCGRVNYVSELSYLYDYTTTDNIATHTDIKKYNIIERRIEQQKSYRCLDSYLKQALAWDRSHPKL